MRELKIFSGQANRKLARDICGFLHLSLGAISLGKFPDGENYCKIEEDVRGRDVFLIQPTSPPVNDNILELLIMIDSCKRASAARITTVIPYFGYARQDRKDEGRVPITAKLVANLITAAGADRVLCMDLHAAQIQGFFDIPVDHLSASKVFCDYFESIRDELGDLVIVSPDVGNVKTANKFASLLDADLAIIDKRRESGMRVASKNLIGTVRDRTVLMVDDMISTAGTVCEAAKLVKDHGAAKVISSATHAVLVGLAMDRLNNAPISRIVVTDTIPNGNRLAPIEHKLQMLTISRLLGEAVHRIHHDMSVSALFRRGVEGS
jgi:ribose-phosphate pyrophosphokinase